MPAWNRSDHGSGIASCRGRGNRPTIPVLPILSISALTSMIASRLCQRWINAEADRDGKVAELARLSLSQPVFAQVLQTETDAGMPLPRAMRRLRNLVLAVLITRDLDGRADLAEVLDTMTAFADFAVQTHLAALTKEMIALHGEPIGEESGKPQEMMVLGMGKLGGGELNESSDIDLIFVYPENGETRTTNAGQKPLSNHEFFTRLGKKLLQDLSAITEAGFTFRVDMALRPIGASGPLVGSLAMLEQYLVVQGREWERYAWIKARALTGRQEYIAALNDIVQPFVYRRYLDIGAIDAKRNLHAQLRAEVVRQETRHPERNNNVKLGRGGIREIEFLAQVFQLIRGGREPSLRDRSTRATLKRLAEKRLLDPALVERLLQTYTFLRNLEHRLQYMDDAQTHVLPANEDDRLTVAKMMGFADTASLLNELGAHRALVAARFDEIFSDKKNEGDRSSDGPEMEMPLPLSDTDGTAALEARLASLGFAEPAAGFFRSDRAPCILSRSADRISACAPARDSHDVRQRLGGSVSDPPSLVARRIARRPHADGGTRLANLRARMPAAARRSAGRHRTPDGYPARAVSCTAIPAAGAGSGKRAHG